MKRRVVRFSVLCVSVVVVLLLALTVRFRWEYATFELTGYPKRLTVHGRHFELLSSPSSESLADAVKSDPSKPLVRVGSVRAIPGLHWHEYEVISRFYQGCPTSTYLRVGPDQYVAYSLLGSC